MSYISYIYVCVCVCVEYVTGCLTSQNKLSRWSFTLLLNNEKRKTEFLETNALSAATN